MNKILKLLLNYIISIPVAIILLSIFAGFLFDDIYIGVYVFSAIMIVLFLFLVIRQIIWYFKKIGDYEDSNTKK